MESLEEMDKLLETYILPRLNHTETENPKKPNNQKEIESVTKSFPPRIPEPDDFTVEFYQTIKEELKPVLLRLFPILKKREHLLTRFLRLSIITLSQTMIL